MKWMFLLVSLLTCSLIQIQLPTTTWLGGMKCPIILSCVLYYALAHERGLLMVCSLLGGILYDALSGIPLGYSSVLFLALGWVASRFRRRLVIEAALTSIVLGTILNLFFTVGLWVFLSHSNLVEVSWGNGFLKLLASAFLGALTSPVVCGLLGSLEHTLGNRERSTGYA